MNNGINWFDPRPGGPNGLAPDRRGLSNYVPAIMTGPDTAIGIGGCGGRRIIPAVFQLLAMAAEFGFDLDKPPSTTPRMDVSGGVAVRSTAAWRPRRRSCWPAPSPPVTAEPGASIRSRSRSRARCGAPAASNEGATEPEQPWSEAVAEDEV